MKLQIYQQDIEDKHSANRRIKFTMLLDEEKGSLERKVYEGNIEITPEMAMTSSEIPRVCMAENAIRVFKKFYLETFLSETT